MGVVSALGALVKKFEKPSEPLFDGDTVTPYGGGWLHTFATPTSQEKAAAAEAAAKAAAIPPRNLFPRRPSPFSAQGDSASMPGGAFTGSPLSASMPVPPVGSERTPFRGLDGCWHDGITGEPLTAEEAGRWGVK